MYQEVLPQTHALGRLWPSFRSKHGSVSWRQSLKLQPRSCVSVTQQRSSPLGGAKDPGSELGASLHKINNTSVMKAGLFLFTIYSLLSYYAFQLYKCNNKKKKSLTTLNNLKTLLPTWRPLFKTHCSSWPVWALVWEGRLHVTPEQGPQKSV